MFVANPPHPVLLLWWWWCAGDGWQQPSLLLRHDSVDSGVAKGGGHGGLAGGSCWKEAPSWHGAPRGGPDAHHPLGRHPKRVVGDRDRDRGDRDRDRQGGHRQRNGSFHPRKGAPFQDKFPGEERKEDKLKFVEEDFVSIAAATAVRITVDTEGGRIHERVLNVCLPVFSALPQPRDDRPPDEGCGPPRWSLG